MKANITIQEAKTEAHFRAMSLIHALGWRDTYVDAVPADFMAREITDDRWVGTFRQYALEGINHGLLLYRGETPAACITYGPVRVGFQNHGGGMVVQFNASGYEGWGEIFSFYTHPDERGKGYGSLLIEEALKRLRSLGFSSAYVFVLRENEKARRFYERHGFIWDGTSQNIPFPPNTICVDLRYTRTL